MSDLWTHTVTWAGATCTVALSGKLDMSGFDDLVHLLASAAEGPNVAAVQVDLAGVSFVDSCGIEALIAGHNAAQAAGCRFTVVRLRPNVRCVIEVSGLLPMFPGEYLAASPAQDHLAG
jgi:anti-anti-sigma factor